LLPFAFITIALAFHAKASFAPSGDQMGRVQIPTQHDPRKRRSRLDPVGVIVQTSGMK